MESTKTLKSDRIPLLQHAGFSYFQPLKIAGRLQIKLAKERRKNVACCVPLSKDVKLALGSCCLGAHELQGNLICPSPCAKKRSNWIYAYIRHEGYGRGTNHNILNLMQFVPIHNEVFLHPIQGM